ncbi:MAG: PEGA domain-containing protein [Trueperaceae bacterium]
MSRLSVRRTSVRSILAALFLALVGAALAQSVVISPRSIVVNPVPGFDVEVFVDKDTSGRDAPAYEVGESMRVSVRPSVDAYVYLFSLSAGGEVEQVLPNRLDGAGSDPLVRAGQTRTFPPSGARYQFTVVPPNGLAKVIAVASREPLDTSTLVSFRGEDDFLASSSMGEDAFARALRIIVTPLPQNDWVSATALYYVGSRPAQAAYGRLEVSSTPSGAEVYVDRSFAGFTPLRYDLRPGTYDVEVVGSGSTYAERVQVRPDRSTTVAATFRPVVRTGTARFVSTPTGADVYVDGSYVGTTPIGSASFDVGTYSVEFRAAGYDTLRRTFEVRAGQDTRVDATLRAQAGTLELTSNVGGARVFLNGRDVGVIPSGTGRLVLRDLASATYEVTLVAPGYRTAVESVRVDAGRTTAITLRQTRY